MELNEGRLLMQTQVQMTLDVPLYPALSTWVLKPDAVAGQGYLMIFVSLSDFLNEPS